MLARVAVGVLVVLSASACGSRVVYQSAAPAVVSDHAVSVHAAPLPGQPPQSQEATPPDPPLAPEATGPPPPPEPRDAQAHVLEETTSPPVTAPRRRAESAEDCDWHANLERATAGRLVDWIILDTGAWGRAEVPGTRIWIAPRTPCEKVYSVAVHEWTHHMQGVVYGDWGVVQRELATYGGAEAVADCGALLLGATWIKYGCKSQRASDAAFAILRGERP